MTIAEWCVFGTLMLYLLTIAPIKWIGFRRFDNARPRDPAFYQDPIAARALGAHLNGIEAFPFFAVAVLLAEFRTGPQRLINELAVLFLIVRIAYVFTYLGNRPTLRSILWAIGFAINLAIFFMPAIRGYLPIQTRSRHCEPTGLAFGAPMTGSEAIHRLQEKKAGLLRRGARHRARIRATRWLGLLKIRIFLQKGLYTTSRSEPVGQIMPSPVILQGGARRSHSSQTLCCYLSDHAKPTLVCG